MGLLDKIFKSERDIAKEEIEEFPWHPLSRMEQLDEVEQESYKRTVAIFKHSTSCGISKMVIKKFEREFQPAEGEKPALYYLDLKAERAISNEIAARFAVRHESPQLLVLKDGEVVRHASHHSVSAEMVG